MDTAPQTVRAITATDLPGVLPVLLADFGGPHPADSPQAASFLAYLRDTSLAWIGLCAGSAARPHAAGLALLMPGRVALLMLPHPGQFSIDPDEQRRLTIQLLAALARFDLFYVQALVEPEAHPLRNLLESCGLHHLTRLQYLARDARPPAPPVEPQGEWTPYGPDAHRLFARTIEETYLKSDDCPELCGVRPIDDVIASHRVARSFNPATWEVLRLAGRPAGCILLNEVGPTQSEIAYLGVTPAFRGRGLGAALLARGLHHARRIGSAQVAVVFDVRNAAAQRLYARCGFVPTAARDAHLLLTQPRRTP